MLSIRSCQQSIIVHLMISIVKSVSVCVQGKEYYGRQKSSKVTFLNETDKVEMN